jgi:hypothetical protein
MRNKYSDEAEWTKELEKANQQFMQPPLASREVLMIQRSANRKDYAYPCQKSPIMEHCNKEVCRHRKYGVGSVGEPPSLDNYNFGALTKILMTPPVWIFEIDGSRLQLTTDELMSYNKFRIKVVETCDILLPVVKQHVWDAIVGDKLQTLELKDAPHDSDDEGKLWFYLEAFCTGAAQAIRREDILLGRPWYDEPNNMIYFRSTDFSRFLDQQHFRAVTGNKIWVILSSKGAGYKSLKIKGKVISVWHLPADKFTRQVEDFTVPPSDMEF